MATFGVVHAHCSHYFALAQLIASLERHRQTSCTHRAQLRAHSLICKPVQFWTRPAKIGG